MLNIVHYKKEIGFFNIIFGNKTDLLGKSYLDSCLKLPENLLVDYLT